MIDNFVLWGFGIGEIGIAVGLFALGVELIKGRDDLVGSGIVNRVLGVIWGVAAIVIAGGLAAIAALTVLVGIYHITIPETGIVHSLGQWIMPAAISTLSIYGLLLLALPSFTKSDRQD